MTNRWARVVVGAGLLAITAAPVNGQAVKTAACGPNAKAAILNFTLKDLDEKDVTLSAYKGKVILLDFWATRADRVMADEELVIGLVGEREQRAYSTWQLDRHEIVNDVFEGRPIAVTW